MSKRLFPIFAQNPVLDTDFEIPLPPKKLKRGEKKLSDWDQIDKLRCFDPAKNDGVTPDQISIRSRKKCTWTCPRNSRCGGHDFKSRVADVTDKRQSWCPYCSGKKLCHDSDCQYCFNRSLASWHETEKLECYDPAKNDGVTPDQISIGSDKKCIWSCPKTSKCGGHDFKSSVNNVTKPNGRWCPYCSGRNLCHDSDCEYCFNRSLASWHDTEKLKCYDPAKNDGVTPDQISIGSDKKCIWSCPKTSKCGGHDFESSVKSVTGPIQSWCPYCATNNGKLCHENDCDYCFQRSFAGFDDKQKVASFDTAKNGNLTPRDVFMNSAKKYWFNCYDCGHDFQSRVYHVTRKQRHWCPFCVGKEVCPTDKNCAKCKFAVQCEHCKTRKAVKLTKWKRMPVCNACYLANLDPEDRRGPLKRAKVSLEIYTLCSIQERAILHDKRSDAGSGSGLWIAEPPTTWDCAILPGENFKPDILWAFDAENRVISTAGSEKLNLGLIAKVVILEIDECSREVHSQSRKVSDTERESRIRAVFHQIPVSFVRATMAHTQHRPLANEDDIFFEKQGKEYQIVAEKTDAYITRIDEIITALRNANQSKTAVRVFIGN